MTSQAWKNSRKLDGSLYVEAFREPGLTDLQTVQAALAGAAAVAPCTLVFSRRTYSFSSVLGSYNLSGVTLDLNGAVLDFSGVSTSTSLTLLDVTGSYSGTPIALTGTAASGQKTIALASAGLAAGQMVRVYSETVWDSMRTSARYGELAWIETVPDAASVTVTAELAASYSTGATAMLQALTPVTDFCMRGGEIIGPAGNDQVIGVQITLGVRCRVFDLRSFDMDKVHVRLVDCADSGVWGCHFEESNHLNQGYGTSFVDASQDCYARGNTYRNVRHSFTTGNQSTSWGITRRIACQGNIISDSAKDTGGGGGDAIDTHAGSEDIVIDGNIVNSSSGHGINVESRSAKIRNNQISNTQGNGITVQNYTDLGGEYDIGGNTIRQVFGSYGIAVVPIVSSIVGCAINGNVVRVATTAVYAVGSSGKVFTGLSITGNPALNSGSTTAVRVDYANTGAISGNGMRAQSVGVQLGDCTNIAVSGNGIELNAASGTTGYGVRVQGTSEGIVVGGNALRHTGSLSAAAAVSFANTTVTYSSARGNVGRGFTAGTVFNVGTGTGNAASDNIT